MQTFSVEALLQMLTFFQFQRKPKRVGIAAGVRCCGLLAAAANVSDIPATDNALN